MLISPPPSSVWAGSSGLQASDIYFEMLIPQLWPFIQPSLPDGVSEPAGRSWGVESWEHGAVGGAGARTSLEGSRRDVSRTIFRREEPSRREALLSSALLSSFYPQGADEVTSGFKVQELLPGAKPVSEP